jgi:DNA (cytosine-5)-methyltransferase 1
MNPTFGSLFAGVGGFDLGFEAAGYDCKFQVEWDKHCQQVLGYHWPDVPRWGDVSEVNGADLPPADVITYGFPCQDLSVAGKRAGLDGDRSNLFFEAIRIITEMREATNGLAPTFAVAENVVGLLNADGGSAMARCLDALAEAGAVAIEWCVLDAQWFGVPQRRRRVFLTACFDPATAERCPNPLFPLAESGARNPSEVEQTGKSVAALTANGVGTCGADDNQAQAGHLIPFRMLGFGHYTDGDEASAVKARDYKDATDLVAFTKGRRAQTSDDYETWDEDRPAPTLNEFDNGDIRTTTAVVFDPSRRDGARPQLDGTCNTLTGHMGTGGNNTPMVAQTRAIGIQGKNIGRQDKNTTNGKGHTEEGDPMFTLTSTDQHAVAQHDLSVRRLTPIECERLMGWPDNHTLHRADGKEASDSQRYKQCGNGVAAPVAQWIAKHLRNAGLSVTQTTNTP